MSIELCERAWRNLEPCGVLMSYWDLRKMDAARAVAPYRAHGIKLFGDSGAFAALSAKKTIDVVDYRTWLVDHASLFDVYANLDVIGDDDATHHNQAVLEEAGLHPIPVFHVGEPWDVLDAMADRYDFIALGGMVSFRRGARVASWIAQAFRTIDGRARVHGFGITRWEFIRDFPWATTDSTTWTAGHRFGHQLVWRGDRLVQLDRKALLASKDRIERAMSITIQQALRCTKLPATPADHAVGDRIALRALALAQANRRRWVPDFTIYCSGV